MSRKILYIIWDATNTELREKNNYTRKEEKLNTENPSISFMKL